SPRNIPDDFNLRAYTGNVADMSPTCRQDMTFRRDWRRQGGCRRHSGGCRVSAAHGVGSPEVSSGSNGRRLGRRRAQADQEEERDRDTAASPGRKRFPRTTADEVSVATGAGKLALRSLFASMNADADEDDSLLTIPDAAGGGSSDGGEETSRAGDDETPGADFSSIRDDDGTASVYSGMGKRVDHGDDGDGEAEAAAALTCRRCLHDMSSCLHDMSSVVSLGGPDDMSAEDIANIARCCPLLELLEAKVEDHQRNYRNYRNYRNWTILPYRTDNMPFPILPPMTMIHPASPLAITSYHTNKARLARHLLASLAMVMGPDRNGIAAMESYRHSHGLHAEQTAAPGKPSYIPTSKLTIYLDDTGSFEPSQQRSSDTDDYSMMRMYRRSEDICTNLWNPRN
ncbi:hypothetical protein THAOC_16199, partial [Thalassiosira oceanica]